VKYINGCYGYILAPDNIEIGKILNYKSKPFDIGNRLNLSKIPVGT
jgi:ribosomal protein L2